MIKKHWIAILISLGILSFLLGCLGRYHWVLDIFSHFRFYYFWYFLLLVPIAFFFKKWVWGSVSLVFALRMGLSLAQFYTSGEPIGEVKDSISVTAINLLSSNQKHQKVMDFIATENTDLVFIQELNPIWFNVLKAIEKDYPYHLSEVRNDNFGIGLWSKNPFDTVIIKRFSAFDIPFIHAQLTVGTEKKVNFIGAHPVPPLIKGFNARNEQFEELNKLVRKLDAPTVLMGDFNCTSYSPNFSRITDQTGLRDSRIWQGRQPSWSSSLPIRIAIDHCLTTDKVLVIDRKIGSNIGSDHFPIVVQLGISN